MIGNTSTLDQVKEILVETLGIQDRADELDEATPLFGAMPELDSLAVLELVTALEDRLEITVDDEEFSGEIFETVGSLASFVEAKQRG